MAPHRTPATATDTHIAGSGHRAPGGRRSFARSATVVTALAVATGGALAAAPAAAAAPSTLAVASAATSTASGASTSTTGSVSLDLTVGSTHLSGSRATNVTCRRAGSTYTVTTNRTTVNGVQVRGNVVIRNYSGPGTYTATVTLSLKGSGVAAAGAVTGVRVTVGDDGGSWSFVRSASGNRFPKLQGQTISGTLSYTCNA